MEEIELIMGTRTERSSPLQVCIPQKSFGWPFVSELNQSIAISLKYITI